MDHVLLRPAAAVALVCTLLVAAWMALPATGAQAQDGPSVLVAQLDGAIDPVADEFVGNALEETRDGGHDALVLQIDTPGGLASSMDSIVRRIVNADDVPVIAWVAPRGARADSAGVFIVLASDVAVMAPGTRMGSATPIQGNGQDIPEDLRKKVLNDAVTQVRGLADAAERNADWAERAVRDADNISAEEALDLDVVEFVAADEEALLDQVHGFTTAAKEIEIRTEDAQVTRMELPFHLRILKTIIDPNILFLLFGAALIGLGFELTHPGAIVPGVVGAICLVLALFGFQVLPINAAGALLMLLAVLLIGAEIFVASGGVLGAGGTVALVLGGLLLFEQDSGIAVDLPVLALVAVLGGGFITLLAHKSLQARRLPAGVGNEELVGVQATVRRELAPTGSVFVRGELWRARTADADGESVPSGTTVTVTGVEGLTLIVVPGSVLAGETSGEDG